MLKFLVFVEGGPAKDFALAHAYLLGADGNAIKGSISFEAGVITCEKRESGVASLVVQYLVEGCGLLVIQTSLLPEREEPYLLSLELARHRIWLLYTKMEDWAMFDAPRDPHLKEGFESTRKVFLDALCVSDSDGVESDCLAKQCLSQAIEVSEQLALAHADLLLAKRKSSGTLPPFPIGCGVVHGRDVKRIGSGFAAENDFIYLNTPWKALTPEEDGYRWAPMDQWARWISQNRVHSIAGPIVGFESYSLPDWLFIWEHDYEAAKDIVFEHTERVMNRYRKIFSSWIAISGVQVNNQFGFSFDQIMELTRMTTMLVKKKAPSARALVEICQPFGDYYALDQLSIPPLMYAEILLQSAVGFDGLALKLLMGQPRPGQYTRDLMQISHLIDQYACFGKPITLLAAVPSAVVSGGEDTLSPEVPFGQDGGYWRWPWSRDTQGRWLEAVFKIAMSKPLVEAVVWYEWDDGPASELPAGGLVDEQLKPKEALSRFAACKKRLRKSSNGSGLASTYADVLRKGGGGGETKAE